MGGGPSISEEDIDELLETTSFNKQELKRWYSKFMKDYPDGQLNKKQFMEIYGNMYGGGTTNLADHIFRSFDHNNDGHISFKELMSSLSVTTRGSLREKLEWAFNVYDVDRSGSVTIDEIGDIVKCMQSVSRSRRRITAADISAMFKSVDSNSDGSLTVDEFVQGIESHPNFIMMLNGKRR